MNSPILAWLLEHYQWRLSLLTGAGIVAATFVFNQLLRDRKSVVWERVSPYV